MAKIHETAEKQKRAFLVSLIEAGSYAPGSRDSKVIKEDADSIARELAGLVHTLDLEIAAQEIVTVREHAPKFGVGTGKAQELADRAAEIEADCFIFDWNPSPSQQRNWEKLSGIPAVDRQELIIRIFADRAVTREAELQVHLAELNYSLPRLSHKYIDLSRQRGGRYGNKGAGETRLETDRRLVEQRIHRLEQELEDVRRRRMVQRKQRERQGIPLCALVGYTNAGKSSLMNALTLPGRKAGSSGLLAEDKLFATVDAASRRYELRKGLPVLLVDTVGFIRRLPHTLIEAFHSTLEEASLADILINVLDASESDVEKFYETTLSVLGELGAGKIPMITVLNKIDRLPSSEILEALMLRYPGSIPVSTVDHRGLAELTAKMEELLAGSVRRFRFPPDRTDLASLLHRSAQVLSETYEDDSITVEARVDEKTAGQLREFIMDNMEKRQD
ncbi:GTPase HflX [Spirochaetia bacterium]|nr:GTPase HflX [Spirochaetia bacterium]